MTPCIFFKLNNIWGWEAKPVKCATNSDALEPEINAEDGLPKDLCPDSLKEHMNSAAGKGVVDDSIFIDCRGRSGQFSKLKKYNNWKKLFSGSHSVIVVFN